MYLSIKISPPKKTKKPKKRGQGPSIQCKHKSGPSCPKIQPLHLVRPLTRPESSSSSHLSRLFGFWDNLRILTTPPHAPLLNPPFIFPIAKASFPPEILFCLRPALHSRYGDSRYRRAALETQAVDAAAQSGCLQYGITSTFRVVRAWSCANQSTIVVPSEDSHQSEYIAPCDARRG